MRRELLADLPPLPQRLSEIRAGSTTAATCDRDNIRREAASQVGRAQRARRSAAALLQLALNVPSLGPASEGVR